MAPIEWKPQYSVGDPAVDHEHRELVDLVNTAAAAILDRRPTADVDRCLTGGGAAGPTGRVSVEDVVSGPGLVRIHRFLGGRADSPAGVGAAALDGSDPLARRALGLWLEAYGAFAGDLALQWLAQGGVYLAGGMAAKLLPDGAGAAPFVAAFNAKREHRPLAEAMPIHLVTEERLGLLGALALAAARLQTG